MGKVGSINWVHTVRQSHSHQIQKNKDGNNFRSPALQAAATIAQDSLPTISQAVTAVITHKKVFYQDLHQLGKTSQKMAGRGSEGEASTNKELLSFANKHIKNVNDNPLNTHGFAGVMIEYLDRNNNDNTLRAPRVLTQSYGINERKNNDLISQLPAMKALKNNPDLLDLGTTKSMLQEAGNSGSAIEIGAVGIAKGSNYGVFREVHREMGDKLTFVDPTIKEQDKHHLAMDGLEYLSSKLPRNSVKLVLSAHLPKTIRHDFLNCAADALATGGLLVYKPGAENIDTTVALLESELLENKSFKLIHISSEYQSALGVDRPDVFVLQKQKGVEI
ncbi:MAG: hypothetical protein ACJAUP_001820 [Cellvibrionaceae bacterium]|jgi:hypothetical protein